MGIKISQLGTKTGKLVSTDLIEIAEKVGITSIYTSKKIAASDFIEVSLDTTPQLGGNLDINGKKIVSTSNGNIELAPHGTGAVIINIPFNTQTVAYTLALTDNGKLVEINNAGAVNLTIPTNASVAFPTGTQILVAQYGAGQITFVPDTGVTMRSSGGKTKIAAQYGMATLIKRGTDEWYLAGDITT